MNCISPEALKKAFLSATAALNNQKEWINEMNVFPVPDGDTGSNMTMTLNTAADSVAKLMNPDYDSLCKLITQGTLRGARGNSGVILSQLLRGFCKEIADSKNIDTVTLAAAFGRGVESAYKAVMKPKEGTILTVAKAMADKAIEVSVCENDIIKFFDTVLKTGDEILEKTPEMLPVLKQAGVVDSGGQGLMVALKGAFDSLNGHDVVLMQPAEVSCTAKGLGAASADIDTADIKFGYCTEFIIDKGITEEHETAFKQFLQGIGDSIVCVCDDDFVKVHVHTNHPGIVIEKALRYGPLNRLKIDNMRFEHNEVLFKEENHEDSEANEVNMPHKDVGFIAVSSGSGLNKIFKDLGVDYIIEGGQTMNPSTEDLIAGIAKVNADTVYVLPNNSNIILAAEQAAFLTEDKKVEIINSRTVPQGLAAMISYIPGEDNKEVFADATTSVKTIEVTYSIRDTSIDGFDISKNDFMAITDGKMTAVEKELDSAVLNGIKATVEPDSAYVSIYYGLDIEKAEAEELAGKVEKNWPDLDVQLVYGGQPVYEYLISVE